MPRYVILTHDHPELHWDLMLEDGDSLLTWRLEDRLAEMQPIIAIPLPNHRLRYLDYEGPVSQNRGQVSQWDSGVFDWMLKTAEKLQIRVQGNRFSGTLILKKQETDDMWTASYSSDGGC